MLTIHAHVHRLPVAASPPRRRSRRRDTRDPSATQDRPIQQLGTQATANTLVLGLPASSARATSKHNRARRRKRWRNRARVAHAAHRRRRVLLRGRRRRERGRRQGGRRYVRFRARRGGGGRGAQKERSRRPGRWGRTPRRNPAATTWRFKPRIPRSPYRRLAEYGRGGVQARCRRRRGVREPRSRPAGRGCERGTRNGFSHPRWRISRPR